MADYFNSGGKLGQVGTEETHLGSADRRDGIGNLVYWAGEVNWVLEKSQISKLKIQN